MRLHAIAQTANNVISTPNGNQQLTSVFSQHKNSDTHQILGYPRVRLTFRIL